MGGAAEAVVVADAAPAAGEEEGRMEGWLYLIRSNRLGLQTSRKRYFVLEDSALRCFKAAPAPSTSASKLEVPPIRCFLRPLSRSGRVAFFGGILCDIFGVLYDPRAPVPLEKKIDWIF